MKSLLLEIRGLNFIYFLLRIRRLKSNLKVIIIVCVIICCTRIEVSSQVYIPMNFEKGVWINENFQKGDISSSEYQFYCDGDTLINNNLVHKLYSLQRWPNEGGPGYTIYGPWITGYIYENESKQILFKARQQLEFDTIYDFNIELGDTLNMGGYPFLVNEIDSIEICGQYHRRYINNLNPGGWFPYTLTEGIGFSNGLLGYSRYIDGESYEFLKCYTEWNNSNCGDCEILLKSPLKQLKYSIYPNPTKDILYIQATKEIINITILTLAGIQVLRQEYFNTNSIETPIILVPGPYLLEIEFLDNSKSVELIIKE